MGVAGKHITKTFGEYKDIKVRSVKGLASQVIHLITARRFAGVVYPGETLVTAMWKEGDKVIFGASSEQVPVVYYYFDSKKSNEG